MSKDCVFHDGSVDAAGYGWVGRRRAHLVAWESANGPVEPGRIIYRDCGQRACVNVAHMRLGGVRLPISDFVAHFESKVRRGPGCWEWQGPRHVRSGHGMFKEANRRVYAHRYAYALWVGEIPAGLVVCHTCDNPPCVRPDHLFLGTIADNNADKLAKGRQEKGPTHHWAKPPDATVEEARALSAAGMSTRKIAAALGVPHQTIYGWVSGKRRIADPIERAP
jgi:hypothetical protein